MVRRIVATKLHGSGVGPEVDSYFDRVVKYVPTEIVGAWIVTKGLVESAAVTHSGTILWVCFYVGVILSALYTLRQTAIPGRPAAALQTVISTGAFIVWALALGEPFTTMLGKGEQSLLGSLLLIFYSLVTGLITPKETSDQR